MFTKNYFSQKQKRLETTAGSSRFPTLKLCISFSSGSLYCVRNTNFTCKLTKSKHKNNLGNALNGNTDESCCKINCVRCWTVTPGSDASNCARSDSQNCTCSTLLPVDPRRSTVPGQPPALWVPSAVSPSLVSSARFLTLT